MAIEFGNTPDKDMISSHQCQELKDDFKSLIERVPFKYLLKDHKLIVDDLEDSDQCQYIIGVGDDYLVSAGHDYNSQHKNVEKLDNILGICDTASTRYSIPPNSSKWGGIPLDLAREIAEHMEFYEDFKIFSQVCSTWRLGSKDAKVPPSCHTPWLMLAEPPRTSKRQYYNLFNGDIRHVDLTVPEQFHIDFPEEKFLNLPPKSLLRDEKSDWRYFSSKGWLVCVTQLGLKITLVNPWSGKVIEVPCIPKDIWSMNVRGGEGHWTKNDFLHLFVKFALSDDPSNSSDFTLAMISSLYKRVSIWRNGDNHWTTLGEPYEHAVDILFYKGKLYWLNNVGHVKVVELGANDGESLAANTVAKLGGEEVSFDLRGQGFLVESKDKLLLVRREPLYSDADSDIEEPLHSVVEEFRTLYFEIWEVNVEMRELCRVNNLGNMAIFVGYNSSFSLEALPGRGCKPNCIYYTDSMYELYAHSPRGGGTDMGVFDLSLGKKIGDFYDGPSRFSNVSPPMWIGG